MASAYLEVTQHESRGRRLELEEFDFRARAVLHTHRVSLIQLSDERYTSLSSPS